MLCNVEREVYVKLSKLNIETGALVTVSEGWKIGPCETPLFSETERNVHVCRSCLRGDTMAKNKPTERGMNTIHEAILRIKAGK